MITANIASSGPNYRHSERNRDSFTSVDLKDLVEERDNLEVGRFLKTILVCLFVCGRWDGNRGLPLFPRTLNDGCVHIFRNPQSREFPLHH